MNIIGFDIFSRCNNMATIILEENILIDKEALNKIYSYYYDIFEKTDSVLITAKINLDKEVEKVLNMGDSIKEKSINDISEIIKDNIIDLEEKLNTIFGFVINYEDYFVDTMVEKGKITKQLYFYKPESDFIYFADLRDINIEKRPLDIFRAINVMKILKAEFGKIGLIRIANNQIDKEHPELYKFEEDSKELILAIMKSLKLKNLNFKILQYEGSNMNGEIYCELF